MNRVTMLSLVAAAALVSTVSTSAMALDIYSNNVGGDTVVGNAVAVTAPVGTTGWVYTNVRANATIGINPSYPQSGNGSVAFNVATNSKADIEYYNLDSGNNLTAMGTLADLTTLSYDWYRDSASTAPTHFQPAFRLLVDADGNLATTTDRGYLIYERVYNEAGAAPTDQWVTVDLVGTDVNMWQRKFTPGTTQENYSISLSEWQTLPNPNGSFLSFNNGAVIYGLSVGVGSGWAGSYLGAIDNVSIGFGSNAPTTYNFEVVPEPASLSLIGLGAIGLLARRRMA